MHKIYNVPHVIVTSVHFPPLPKDPGSSTPVGTDKNNDHLTIFGSTARADGSPRLFKVVVPRLDCNFNGTGDMFAALMIARLREVVFASGVASGSGVALGQARSWVSPDDVPPSRLPLAKATERVLASMHDVLQRTMLARNAELSAFSSPESKNAKQDAPSGNEPAEKNQENVAKQRFLRETKAAEVRLVRNVRFLQQPETKFSAAEWTPEL